ncbi:MAG: hypothetical protein QG607_410, partial [Patescibacteria group bacterium]|nr:hypothetical protein [Patescibacteria group bacterium]
MKKNITKKQLDLLKKLNKELDSGAREQLQSLLIQLKDELAAQQRLVDELAFERLVASYEMSESVTQLVEYGASFDSR